jgi:hypothetical protein
VIADHLGGGVDELLHRFDGEVLFFIVGLVVLALDHVSLGAAEDLCDFVLLQNLVLLSGDACMFAATGRIVTVLKFVGKNPVVLSFVQTVRLLVLVAEIALQVLSVGRSGSHGGNLSFIGASGSGDVGSNLVVGNQILVILPGGGFLVEAFGCSLVSITLFSLKIDSLHGVQVVRLTLLTNAVSSSLQEFVQVCNGFPLSLEAILSIDKRGAREELFSHGAVVVRLFSTLAEIAVALWGEVLLYAGRGVPHLRVVKLGFKVFVLVGLAKESLSGDVLKMKLSFSFFFSDPYLMFENARWLIGSAAWPYFNLFALDASNLSAPFKVSLSFT